jgi:hypothetical protein
MLGTRFASRPGGGLVTVGTVVGLLVALGATLFGIGAANNAIANFDASSWLWSSQKGEVARVNGVTGRVDTRQKITDAQGHTIEISQSDRYVVMRDLTTGKVSLLDLSSLQVSATTQTTAGVGVTVALQGDTAFVIDAVQGVVSQLNPSTLQPVGQPLRFLPGLAGGRFDDAGRLWLLIPSEGTVVAVKPAPVASPRAGGGAGGATADPHVVKTVPVAQPAHDLAISVLDTGVAVLDKTATTLTTLRGDVRHTVTLPLTGPGVMPGRTSGADVPVTVVDDRRVYVVNGDQVAAFAVPGASPQLQACVAWARHFYCADNATGTVYALDVSGHLTTTIAIPNAGGVLELDVRESHLFINAPNSAGARVVDEKGQVKSVDKYANNILGGDPPPVPPVPPPPPKPVVGPPGAPSKVVASAGNAAARVAWGPAPANGSAVLKYVVEGGGQKVEVGASQRALDVTGLTNGQSYTFTVYAVNAKGAGPKRASNPVMPTSQVPDPPASVTAKDNPDGTVAISWPAANGLGHKVLRYTVTAICACAAPEPVTVDKTAVTLPAGALAYGTQYAFTVTAVNDVGASSKASPPSNTVVPYTVPGAPGGLAVTTASNQRGAVNVQWQPAAANGRPILRYVVTVDGRPQNVTGANGVALSGLADGATVKVTVAAVNAAGTGPASGPKTATTIRPPKITLTSASAGYNDMTVNFAVDNGGSPGTTTCSFAIIGGGSASGNCGSLRVGGLWPANTYWGSVTVTNAAGSASGSANATTPVMNGTVICGDQSYCGRGGSNGGGIGTYRSPTQNPSQATGEVYSPDRYQATCWTNGESINAKPWGGKQDARWIRIKYRGDSYIPFAWFTLDGGDNPAMLPAC